MNIKITGLDKIQQELERMKNDLPKQVISNALVSANEVISTFKEDIEKEGATVSAVLENNQVKINSSNLSEDLHDRIQKAIFDKMGK